MKLRSILLWAASALIVVITGCNSTSGPIGMGFGPDGGFVDSGAEDVDTGDADAESTDAQDTATVDTEVVPEDVSLDVDVGSESALNCEALTLDTNVSYAMSDPILVEGVPDSLLGSLNATWQFGEERVELLLVHAPEERAVVLIAPFDALAMGEPTPAQLFLSTGSVECPLPEIQLAPLPVADRDDFLRSVVSLDAAFDRTLGLLDVQPEVHTLGVASSDDPLATLAAVSALLDPKINPDSILDMAAGTSLNYPLNDEALLMLSRMTVASGLPQALEAYHGALDELERDLSEKDISDCLSSPFHLETADEFRCWLERRRRTSTYLEPVAEDLAEASGVLALGLNAAAAYNPALLVNPVYIKTLAVVNGFSLVMTTTSVVLSAVTDLIPHKFVGPLYAKCEEVSFAIDERSPGFCTEAAVSVSGVDVTIDPLDILELVINRLLPEQGKRALEKLEVPEKYIDDVLELIGAALEKAFELIGVAVGDRLDFTVIPASWTESVITLEPADFEGELASYTQFEKDTLSDGTTSYGVKLEGWDWDVRPGVEQMTVRTIPQRFEGVSPQATGTVELEVLEWKLEILPRHGYGLVDEPVCFTAYIPGREELRPLEWIVQEPLVPLGDLTGPSLCVTSPETGLFFGVEPSVFVRLAGDYFADDPRAVAGATVEFVEEAQGCPCQGEYTASLFREVNPDPTNTSYDLSASCSTNDVSISEGFGDSLSVSYSCEDGNPRSAFFGSAAPVDPGTYVGEDVRVDIDLPNGSFRSADFRNMGIPGESSRMISIREVAEGCYQGEWSGSRTAESSNELFSVVEVANGSGSFSGGPACSSDCSDEERNACGGCSELQHQLGEPCGACDSGVWACDGPNTLKCDGDQGADAQNPCGGCGMLEGNPGDSCGECEQGTYVCLESGEGVECVGDLELRNPCGGCELLGHAPGEPCGACNAGTYTCTSPDTVSCDDPGDTVRNDCGGCTPLTSASGAACRASRCDLGVLECAGTDQLSCTPTEPLCLPTRCRDLDDMPDECEARADCRYMMPGCGVDDVAPLTTAGCYPVEDCRVSPDVCIDGEQCARRGVRPTCAEDTPPCDLCGEVENLCQPSN